jgi:hypothetical protein
MTRAPDVRTGLGCEYDVPATTTFASLWGGCDD